MAKAAAEHGMNSAKDVHRVMAALEKKVHEHDKLIPDIEDREEESLDEYESWKDAATR